MSKSSGNMFAYQPRAEDNTYFVNELKAELIHNRYCKNC